MVMVGDRSAPLLALAFRPPLRSRLLPARLTALGRQHRVASAGRASIDVTAVTAVITASGSLAP